MPWLSEMEHDSAVLFAEGVSLKDIGKGFGYVNPYKQAWAYLNSVRQKLNLGHLSLRELQKELVRRGYHERPYYFMHNGEDGPECALCARYQSKLNKVEVPM